MATEQFFSDDFDASSSDEELQNTNPIKKRRGISNDYTMVKSYPDKKLAVANIKSQNLWWVQRQHTSIEGVKVFYHCKYSKYCSAKLYLLMEQHTTEVKLYQTEKPHDHFVEKIVGIPGDVKQKIDELFNSGLTKPKPILRNIRESGLTSTFLTTL
jgi:hypothetical protein